MSLIDKISQFIFGPKPAAPTVDPVVQAVNEKPVAPKETKPAAKTTKPRMSKDEWLKKPAAAPAPKKRTFVKRDESAAPAKVAPVKKPRAAVKKAK